MADRPNILFALADDAGMHFGAYGCPWVATPAFDRVAQHGVLFTNAYTCNSKCAHSRASIITGRGSSVSRHGLQLLLATSTDRRISLMDRSTRSQRSICARLERELTKQGDPRMTSVAQTSARPSQQTPRASGAVPMSACWRESLSRRAGASQWTLILKRRSSNGRSPAEMKAPPQTAWNSPLIAMPHVRRLLHQGVLTDESSRRLLGQH